MSEERRFPETFTVTFRAKRTDIPAEIRVRHLLKHALRSRRLDAPIRRG